MRSLTGGWTGMRLPSVPAAEGESAHQTALRSMADLCDIEPEEMTPLDIPPALIYPAPAGAGKRARGRGVISIYVMYAVQPPPDGPLEDADIEDDEDCYDW